MQGNITWEVVFLLVAVASGVLGIWWRIERRIEKAEAESAKQYEQCHARISAAANSLSEYKLKATEQFARHRGSTRSSSPSAAIRCRAALRRASARRTR